MKEHTDRKKRIGKVYFYGALPTKGKAPYGGGEIGNLRTLKMLESFGIAVTVIKQRRSSVKSSKLYNIITYPGRTLLTLFEYFLKIVFGSRTNICHVVGFAGVTLASECLYIYLSRLLGYKTIYELRGGRVIESFYNGGSTYQYFFTACLRNSTAIFTQGKENMPLLTSLCDTPIYYYPNGVSDTFMPLHCPKKPKDHLNIIYFGRIEQEKNIQLILDAFKIIRERYKVAHITVIGNGNDAYMSQMREHAHVCLPLDSYEFINGCSHENLPGYLERMHFYLFPSAQKSEGQSNAITEAMSFGIVPIVSPQGFSRSLVDDEVLVVENYKAEEYAERVIQIVESNEYDKYSSKMYERIKNNFTEDAIAEMTRPVYCSFFS